LILKGMMKKYDKDLVNIKMMIEKLGKDNHIEIINLIKNCPRNNYFINNDQTLKYYKNINYEDLSIKITNEKIYNFIKSCLTILPQNRNILWNKKI